MGFAILLSAQNFSLESFPTSKTEILFIGIFMVSVVFVILLFLLFSSSGRTGRKYDEYDENKEREEIAQKIEEKEIYAKEEYEDPEAVKALEWMKRRRKNAAKILAQLEIKKVNVGLSQEEEIKRKFYEQELFLIQEELLSNDAFLAELSRKADWALQQALNGVPSKEIRQKLIDEGYSKKEIEIIKIIFNKRKSKLKEKVEENANF